MDALIAAIDPGRDKFGLAVASGELIFSAVMPVFAMSVAVSCIKKGSFGELKQFVREGTPSCCRPETVLLGSGTGHAPFAAALEEAGVRFELVDERNSTMAARKIYLELHPPAGLARLWPKSLMVPPRDIDDLAALVLIRQYYKSQMA